MEDEHFQSRGCFEDRISSGCCLVSAPFISVLDMFGPPEPFVCSDLGRVRQEVPLEGRTLKIPSIGLLGATDSLLLWVAEAQVVSDSGAN